MPGVIMENGSRNGSHTNHDRDQRPNGVNGATHTSDKGKGRAEPQQMTPISPTAPNCLNGAFGDETQHQNGGGDALPQDMKERMGQLPPEIAHITQGYMPLSTLLSRLAQKTHNDLARTVMDLSQMPVPSSAVNGNASHISTTDDNSVENLNKKLKLLKFAQDAHTEWTKALVITGWSRRADDVSKIIDLKIHLDQQNQFYMNAILELSELKLGLIHARLPNPDLKTALEVLTTGKASWMPELGYIEPPPLTPREVLRSLEKLNTLLSMRLNLHDYDTMPLQFKDYTIKSGRATFKVIGEFEVDLTIADEDPNAQFWFIDFRFLFSPSLSVLTPPIRSHIESRVNEALSKDGLSGCYKYLHEMILTHKISEFRRQGIELSRAKWIECLKIEPLHRALSIQYWSEKYSPKHLRSWIILGVHSGTRKDGLPDPKATSRLSIRWFRESQEVIDADIPFDASNISTESLLKTVIAQHTSHTLTMVYESLREKSLYASRELGLFLSVSATDPAESELRVQLTNDQHLTVKIEPISGRFIFSPATRLNADWEARLNFMTQTTQTSPPPHPPPAVDVLKAIVYVRYGLMLEEINSHALSVGWVRHQSPNISRDTLQRVMPKDTEQTLWFRRSGWVDGWFVVVCMSMSGERWLLLETSDAPTTFNTSNNSLNKAPSVITSAIDIPIKTASPTATYSFLSTLSIFAAALISHYVNLRALHSSHALHTLRQGRRSRAVTLPSIYVRFSDVLPSKNKSPRTGRPWAKDVIRVSFQGIEIVPEKILDVNEPAGPVSQDQTSQTSKQVSQTIATQKAPLQENVVMVTEARMVVPLPKALAGINERVDRDIAFDAESGCFAFRLRSKVGESIIASLIERAVRVERLVDFVQVLQKHEKSLKCETISLGKIIFTYGDTSGIQRSDAMHVDSTFSRSYKATVDFSAVENIMSLILERENPHLRILDHLTKILNDREGLDGVATLLPLTLPVLHGFDAIESAWTSVPSDKGEVHINVRAIDWYIIRYNLNLNSTSQPSSSPGKIMFEVRLRQRKGDPWWYVRRVDNSRSKEADDLDLLLKPLWAAKGSGWQGMRVSGVAQSSGVEELLVKMDEVVRNLDFTKNGEPAGSAIAAKETTAPPTAAPKQARPTALMQQQRQQPTPNQSQNQSQGRNTHVKREVVEID